jgi:biopolymer transport protein ExbD
MQLKPKQKRKPVINITSLIDVLFLLLIFLLVSTTFIEEPGMKLTLPKAESAEVGAKKEFTLYLTKDGDMFLNNAPVAVDSLESRLKSVLPEMQEESLTLKADTETSHGIVVTAMDKARLAGVKKLVVATAPTPKRTKE